MKFNIPKETKSELKITRSLYLVDLVVFMGGICITWTLSNFVYIKLQIFYYIFTLFSLIFLLMRPSDNPDKRNYQALYFAIIRDKQCYSSINNIE